MKRQKVTSSNIRSVGYDADRSLLEVEFQSGGVYRYHNVPVKAYRDFVSAPSIGQAFHKAIKPHYKFEPVPQEDDVLKSRSKDELAKAPKLSDEEIRAARERGIKDRKAAEKSVHPKTHIHAHRVIKVRR